MTLHFKYTSAFFLEQAWTILLNTFLNVHEFENDIALEYS